MTSQPISRGSAGRVRAVETIVGFTPEVVRAPFLLRCGAALIDYMLVVVGPVVFLILGRMMGSDGASLLNGELNNVGWITAVLISMANLIVLPAIGGRSIGKMVAGITIVNISGNPPSLKAMVLRQTVGYLLLLASVGLGFLTSLFSSKGRALHDYLFGTVVIFADRSRRMN